MFRKCSETQDVFNYRNYNLKKLAFYSLLKSLKKKFVLYYGTVLFLALCNSTIKYVKSFKF